jgi:sugar/nucleoside kinase (ribokinase family)
MTAPATDGRVADTAYAGLAARLERADPAPVVALPDGSVDRYVELSRGGEAVDARETFGRAVAAGEATEFRATTRSTDPGGQAPNVARQAAALGAEASLYGHLDHEVFEAFAFPTWSFGAPARVDVHGFDDGDVLFSTPSADLRSWGIADLRRVESSAGRLADAGVVAVSNWVGVPGVADALRAVPEFVDGAAVLFDPGDVTPLDDGELDTMAEVLGSLADALDGPVVPNVDDDELARLAAYAGCRSESVAERLAAVREAFGADGVVLHGVEQAAVCHDGAVVRVPNLDPPADIVRHTGAGDRFGGALAVALAADWPWTPALALGNVAAVHYLETGESADTAGVRDLLDRRL